MPWCRTGQNQVRYRGDRIMTAAVLATFDSAALPAPVAADGEISVELGVVLAGHQQRLGHRLQFHGGRQAHVLLAGQQRLGLRVGMGGAGGEPADQPVHRRVQVLLAGQPTCATPWAPPGTTSGSSSWPKPSPSPWPASAPGRRPPPSTLTPGAGGLAAAVLIGASPGCCPPSRPPASHPPRPSGPSRAPAAPEADGGLADREAGRRSDSLQAISGPCLLHVCSSVRT